MAPIGGSEACFSSFYFTMVLPVQNVNLLGKCSLTVANHSECHKLFLKCRILLRMFASFMWVCYLSGLCINRQCFVLSCDHNLHDFHCVFLVGAFDVELWYIYLRCWKRFFDIWLGVLLILGYWCLFAAYETGAYRDRTEAALVVFYIGCT